MTRNILFSDSNLLTLEFYKYIIEFYFIVYIGQCLCQNTEAKGILLFVLQPSPSIDHIDYLDFSLMHVFLYT